MRPRHGSGKRTDQPGVAEIMRAAGLTHGGFYKHFDSREELIEEAVQRALTERGPELEELLAAADDPLAAFAEWYVSKRTGTTPATAAVSSRLVWMCRASAAAPRRRTACRSSATSRC